MKRDNIGSRLTASDLADRIRTHGRDTYMLFNSVVVSVAIANGSYVFALLLASPVSPFLWAPFMLASFGFVVVTFFGPLSTTLLIVFVPDWRHIVLPILQALIVFLMFSMLLPSGAHIPLLTDWYLAIAAHALIGSLWIWSERIGVGRSTYDPSLQQLVRDRLELLRTTGISAAFGGLLWIGIWLAMRLWVVPLHPDLLAFQGALGIVAFFQAIIAVAQIENGRRRLLAASATILQSGHALAGRARDD